MTPELRPQEIIELYWLTQLAIEEDAEILEVVYFEAA